jgi:hypothetical protein
MALSETSGAAATLARCRGREPPGQGNANDARSSAAKKAFSATSHDHNASISSLIHE